MYWKEQVSDKGAGSGVSLGESPLPLAVAHVRKGDCGVGED